MRTLRSTPALLLIASLAACTTPAASPPPATSPTPVGTSGTPGATSPAPGDSPSTPPATSPTPATPAAGSELVLLTHDSFALTPEVLGTFETANGVKVRVLKAGDAGAALDLAILTKERPLADVFFGVDNTFLSRALAADIFVPYAATGVERVPAAFRLDAEQRVTPVDYGDVCINYDREQVGAGRRLPLPARLEDLTRPEYKGTLVVQDPGASSTGLAFLLATVAHFGETGDYTWRDYWADLRRNDVQVTTGWEEAYNSAFSGGAGTGDRPFVVSYASSPPVEVVFADPQPADAPTGVLVDGCFRQVEFAGVLRGTQRQELAQRFIDFLLTRPVQEDVPLSMFVFPVDPDAKLPDVFVKHAPAVAKPLTLPAERIERDRERWIDEWTETVLR